MQSAPSEKTNFPTYDFVETDKVPEPEDAKMGDYEIGSDHWDKETGLYVCGRCGRMWDGNAQCYPCIPDY